MPLIFIKLNSNNLEAVLKSFGGDGVIMRIGDMFMCLYTCNRWSARKSPAYRQRQILAWLSDELHIEATIKTFQKISLTVSLVSPHMIALGKIDIVWLGSCDRACSQTNVSQEDRKLQASVLHGVVWALAA